MPDIGQLTAPELIAAVNDRNGDILNARRLKNHRDDGGSRFYANRLYSLPAYIGWLHDKVTARLRARESNTDAEQYAKHKLRMAERSRQKTLAARDIGEIPEPQFVEERDACEFNLELFCTTFLAGWFAKVFCEQHRQLIKEIEKVVLDGGQQAVALPRHRGKTTITKAACLWAALFGHRQYVLWLAAQDEMADAAVSGFWMTLRNNEKIVAAFPEACYPLVQGGADQRSRPLYHGRELNMGRSGGQIIFPDIEGSPAASVVLQAGGLMTAMRGLTYDRPDGTIVRPDLVILDDPQTDESARSPAQCDTREKLINGAVLGLAGPGVKIAAIMPCTIIRHGDLSSRILNRKLNPEWHGIIGKMLETLPANMPLWDKYNSIRVASLNDDNTIRQATEFYVQHRTEMDRAASATWESDHNPDEASAIQHGMNLYFADKESFFAEYQNCPLQAWDAVEQLDPDALIQRHNLLPRWIVPDDTEVITAFVDVHKDILYWMVVAWRQNFSGQIAAYGAWPDQRSAFFEQRNADYKMGAIESFRQKSLETQLEMAFFELFPILDREWQTESGETMRLRLSLIDANWHESTRVVDKFAAKSDWRGKIFPSHGRAISAGQKPIAAWRREKKDLFGPDWTVPFDKNDRLWRHVVYDANVWKSHCAEFLLADPDGAAAASFHKPEQQFDHRLLVDHFVAEKREPKIGPYRTADVWTLPDNRPDNHWWDCFVGSAVAASMCGLRIPQLKSKAAEPAPKKKRRSRVHYGEWQTQT